MSLTISMLHSSQHHKVLSTSFVEGDNDMADLRINFAGIESPNPFWLASAPPTNSGYQVQRAFEAGGEALYGKR